MGIPTEEVVVPLYIHWYFVMLRTCMTSCFFIDYGDKRTGRLISYSERFSTGLLESTWVQVSSSTCHRTKYASISLYGKLHQLEYYLNIFQALLHLSS